MSVLLSIKPKYVEKILAREKAYEFRRAIFTRRDVRHVVIYASSPVQKIVAFFEIGAILEDVPHRLWNRCKEKAGITGDEFHQYFAGKETGFAIEIKNLQRYLPPLDPRDVFEEFHAPQSFRYLEVHPPSLGSTLLH